MIESVRAAKAKGRAVTSELNPVSLLLANEWENIERVGPYALSTWTGDGQTCGVRASRTNSAAARSVAAIGRDAKTVKSPRDIRSALRRCSSS